MSERYGNCELCQGTGLVKRLDFRGKEIEVNCPQCGGDGCSGDIKRYHG